jgi:hypothetical protein
VSSKSHRCPLDPRRSATSGTGPTPFWEGMGMACAYSL